MNNQKTVLVTGGASGIGRSISLKFAENGWHVLCHYNSSQPEAESLQKEVSALEGSCELFKVNFRNSVEIDELVQRLEHRSVDSLINNAGTYVFQKNFQELTCDDLVSTFTVNTFSHMLLAFALFPGMLARSFGRIVNISSIAAKYGGSGSSVHYGCSKMALEGLTKTLAREGAPYNVLVNTIRPGVIDTEFHTKYPKDMEKRTQLIPVKRMGKVSEVADLTYYLGAEENSFITNETIAVAGGE